jgi:hypothetical protein
MNLADFISLSEYLLGLPWQAPLPPLANLQPYNDLANVYMAQLTAWSLEGPFMNELLTNWEGIQRQPEPQKTASVNAILNDPATGPLCLLARQIILAWYTGFHPWSMGQQPTPDPANYEAALVWQLAQAHPMGVPVSFGYWQDVPK